MAIKKEEYFPRGRSSSTKPALRKSKDKLFKKYKKPKKNRKKNTEQLIVESKDTTTSVNEYTPVKYVIRPLSYQTLEEGMVLLGRIREIWPYHMFVCLPGRLSAKVSIAAVSNPYSDSLARLQDLEITDQECPSLNKLFRIGQQVVCSVVEVKKDGELLAVSVSLEPSLVNRERGHHSVRAGHTLVAAVLSVEDHGYMLHSGITGLTAFLRTGNTTRYVNRHNSGRPLVVGELVRCLVTKCTLGRSSSRVEVTIDPDSVGQAVLTKVNSHALHPSTTVTCVVDQVVARGLVVNLGMWKAYIEASQLSNCWSLPKHYKPNTELKATVLYVLPHSDFQVSSKPVYLTLKNVNEDVVPKIIVGETTRGIVVSSSPRGVFICLGDEKDDELGNKGFVSIRRLGENVEKNNIAIKFPKGKLVTTRVLAFDYVEQVYNCSLERSKLEQQYVKLDQLKAGDRVTCKVIGVEDRCIRLAFGSIRVCAFKEHSADVPYPNLSQSFVVEDVVDARVLRVNLETRQVNVTLKETLIRTPALCSYEAAQLHDCYWGTVRHVRDSSLYVTFYNDVSGTVQLIGPHQPFTAGQLVKCYITYVNAQEEKLLLSLSPQQSRRVPQLTIGKMYELVVSDMRPDSLIVSAVDFIDIDGVIPKCHLHTLYAEGDFLKAWFYLKKAGKNYFSPNPAIQKFFTVKETVQTHSKLTCLVANVTTKKITVHTPLQEIPLVSIPKEEWLEDNIPEKHQLVTMYVESIDLDCKSLKLTFTEPKKTLEEAEPGVDSDCNKEAIEKKRGNHHETVESSSNSSNKGASVPSNDLVTCKKKRKKNNSECSVDSAVSGPCENNKDQASIKPPLAKRLKTDSKGSDQVSQRKKKNKNNTQDINKDLEHSDIKPGLSVVTKDKHINEVTNIKVIKDKTNPNKKTKNSVMYKSGAKDIQKLTLTDTGFMWDIKLEDLNKPAEEPLEDVEEEIEDITKGKKKKTAAERRKAAKEEEARLREVEKTLLNSESNPQSVDHFDRAVLARPDDADLWIKYMSHHLQATEIEKARSVARRALNTINQRHEEERLNVWIALLNLENLFGTQESLKDTLDEALRMNDEFTVYCKMLQIYCQSSKYQDVEHLVNMMLRKFRSSATCWVQCCSALMKCSLSDKARSLLQGAISALPSKEHVNLLCKFALLENQFGFSEQSQTLFEHILTSYPKRTDIWSVYVDMLVKSNKIEIARQILERASRQKLPARKMKMLFSKWINFEEKHGSTDKVEHVRKQAVAYVNNVTKKLD